MHVTIGMTSVRGLSRGNISGVSLNDVNPVAGDVVYVDGRAVRLTWVSRPVRTLNEGVYYEFDAEPLNLRGESENVRA